MIWTKRKEPGSWEWVMVSKDEGIIGWKWGGRFSKVKKESHVRIRRGEGSLKQEKAWQIWETKGKFEWLICNV